MQLILNIGLKVGRTSQLNTVVDTLAALTRAGFAVVDHRVHQSNTESTVVADVSLSLAHLPPASWPDLYGLSCELGQDCIAAWAPAVDVGALVGPLAEAWGDFSPEYFLTLDGAPLAVATVEA